MTILAHVHGGGASAAPRPAGPSFRMVVVNGWHAHPRCVGERFCRCGLCHLASECAEPDACVVLDGAA